MIILGLSSRDKQAAPANKEIEAKIKSHKDEKYTESLDIVCYYVVFKLFDD